MTRILISFVACAGLLLGVNVAGQEAGEAPSHPRRGLAEVMDRDGATIGTATFTEAENGAVRIELQIVEFAGATEGEHGVHIHESGECEPPDFESAGDHYNPTGQEHGLLNPEGPHAGDLPNIRFDDEGSANYDVVTQRVTLDESGLLSSSGTAMILHENADDYTSESETGDRIACGVIVPHPDEAD